MTPAGDNPGPKDTSDLTADIDSLLKDVAQTTGRIEQHVASMPAITEDGPHAADALAGQVDGLLSEQPAADPVAAIESLDAQLAELTAQLLDNKPQPAAADVPEVEPPTESPKPEPPKPTPPVVHAEPPAAVAPPAPVQPELQVAPPPAPPPPEEAVGVTQDEAAALAAPEPSETSEPEPAGGFFGILAAVSRPIAHKSASFRLLLGVVAVGNLALALVAWAVVLLRSPPPPVESPAYDLSTGTLPRPVEPRAAEPAPAAPAAPAAKPAGGH